MEDEVAVEISGLLKLPVTRGRCYLIALSRDLTDWEDRRNWRKDRQRRFKTAEKGRSGLRYQSSTQGAHAES